MCVYYGNITVAKNNNNYAKESCLLFSVIFLLATHFSLRKSLTHTFLSLSHQSVTLFPFVSFQLFSKKIKGKLCSY